MIEPAAFFDALRARGFTFFTGVPDSLLKDFCAFVTDHTEPRDHVIAANEGGAVALAAGHYLATSRAAIVYMQNSGQGNAVNPLTSLADPEVFGIPMLLLVGWRGEPGRKDEPQHVKQGRITGDLFDAMEVPHAILPGDMAQAEEVLDAAIRSMRERSAPYAIVIREGTFGPYRLRANVTTEFELNREGALRVILDRVRELHPIVVTTTGKASRELFEYRQLLGDVQAADFRTVGCMGHASQIALGIALARPDRRVLCLDGDGAVIMHMGGVAIIGAQRPENFIHIVINNGCHDSVGGQPTVGFDIDIPQVAQACGYRAALSVETSAGICAALDEILSAAGPSLLEVKVNPGARSDLGRPTSSPASNKTDLMRYLEG